MSRTTIMEETKELMITLCSYYIKNKQMLLDVYKHEDFISSYGEFMNTMTPYLWDPEFWEDIPIHIRRVQLDLHVQVVSPKVPLPDE